MATTHDAFEHLQRALLKPSIVVFPKHYLNNVFVICPVCRNYALERSWCETCNKSGLIKDK